MINRVPIHAAGAVFVVLALASGSPVRAQCDTTPPDLTGLSFSPSSINTTSSSQMVTCNMTLTDDLAGVSTATCTFTAPDFFHGASCSATAPTSGTPLNGVWSCTITVPRYALSGDWTANVSAGDAVGNSAPFDPEFLGFPFTLTVTSDPDTVAPALTVFSIVPGSVNVSAASQTVICNMTLTDAKSGVATAFCQVSAPDSDQAVGCGSNTPSSGTRANGTFSCTLTIPRYADAGTWIPTVFASDVVGNFPFSPFMPVATLAVTASPEDITAPSLTSFGLAPTSISTGGGPRTVTCTMGVADSLAGVNAATCTLNIQSFFPEFVMQSQSCTATAPSSGTRNSGTFQCGVVFPQYSAGGMWMSSVSLDDLTGNVADLPRADLLTVDCNAGDLETTCRFAVDKQTLTWDVVGGATQYNVYRGPFTNLTDANANHLPDGGYGTCQNSRDGNLTDTTFVDSNIPSAAEKGFFYLVSYKSSGVEKGLGMNTFGMARTIAAPCP